jgi:PAS domain S-box-containing protein
MIVDISGDNRQDSPDTRRVASHQSTPFLDREEEAYEDFGGLTQLFRLILDNIPQAIFWKDRNSNYLGCNVKFAIGAGVDSSEKIKGKTDYDLPWAEEEAESYRVIDARVMDGDKPAYHIMETQLQANGQKAYVDANKIPLHDAAGRVIGVLGTFEDITERIRTQQALQKAHDELELRVRERTSALENTNRLLQQEIIERRRVEATEREQRTLAEALRETASVINSTLEPDQVLDRILSQIGRVVRHTRASIVMVHGDTAATVRRRSPRSKSPSEGPKEYFSIDSFPMLRRMIDCKQPLIIENTQTSPLWIVSPSNRRTRSYLGAPILVENEVIGFINLEGTTKGFFLSTDGERLKAFADQAAIAIQNALLYERAQTTAALEERQQLARDLHDAVSQTLWSISLIADVLPTLYASEREEGARLLCRLRQLTQGALTEMRALLMELRPAALTEAKIEDLLRQLVDGAMSRKKIKVAFSVDGAYSLPPNVQEVVYRIAQEALNNITRHSHASRASVRLRGDHDCVVLRIRDDGRGFDEKFSPGHLGLEIMRERSESIGAYLRIKSHIGGGTLVTLRWPAAHMTRDLKAKGGAANV